MIPFHQPGVLGNVIKSQTVGTTVTTIAHGLGQIPDLVIISPVNSTAVYVCQSSAADATNVYLIASAALTTCVDIEVRFYVK